MAASVQRPASRQYSVLIVCPHTLAREGLRLLLAQDEDLRVVGLAADASELVALLPRLQPDVILAGYGWASQDCVALLQRLKADRPGLPVLVVSPDISPDQVQAALAAGATGYLPLDADLDELVRAVSTVGRGELTLHPAIVPALLSLLAGRSAEASLPTLDDLTPRERGVLAHVAHGLSDRDIAQALFISVRTVQTHLSHIYAKLDVHSRTEAALIAVREGWLSPLDDRRGGTEDR